MPSEAKKLVVHDSGLLTLSRIIPIPPNIVRIDLWQPRMDEEGPDNSSANDMDVHGHTRCRIHA